MGNVSTRQTFRTGLLLTYNLTSRLSSTTSVYYHHDENQGSVSTGTTSGDTGAQDSLDLLLGFNYTINKRLALHLNYNHTSQSALESTPGYSRNSYSAGLTYSY